jgi:hypothetical protein
VSNISHDTNDWSDNNEGGTSYRLCDLAAKIIVVRSDTNMPSWNVPALSTPPVAHGAKRRRVQGEGRDGLPLVGTNHSESGVIDSNADESSYLVADMASATDMASVTDSGFGCENGVLIIEPMHAEIVLGKKFASWKESAERLLARMQPRITKLFQYSSTVSPASATDLGATADGSPSCATIRLEEKTILQLPKPKGKIDRKTVLSIVKLLRKVLTTGNPELDAQVVVYEGWTG